ncbi:MAG TPA: hypothetical protein VMT95_15750 [Candidatus Binatia bacterium]|nr:hypothetical protein [Candidatus Binatia bacterium]
MDSSALQRSFSGAAVTASAVAVLAGCSGTWQGSAPSQTAGVSGGPLHTLAPIVNSHPAAIDRDLFVSISGNEVIVLKNKTYHYARKIKKGLNGSYGEWIDKNGNLYVANGGGHNVTEYKPSNSSPSCTYSGQLRNPVDVATDAVGNVYVTDSVDNIIAEYPQCGGSRSNIYFVNFPLGIAVDASGDILGRIALGCVTA